LLALAARAESWPMFRGNQALLGVAKGSLASKLTLLWSFKTGGPVKSSPAIEQNQVFIGSADGNVYALNFGRRKEVVGGKDRRWQSNPRPLVLENKVYVGSSDSWLYALESKSGKIVVEVSDRRKDPGRAQLDQSRRGIKNSGRQLRFQNCIALRPPKVRSFGLTKAGITINGSPRSGG